MDTATALCQRFGNVYLLCRLLVPGVDYTQFPEVYTYVGQDLDPGAAAWLRDPQRPAAPSASWRLLRR